MLKKKLLAFALAGTMAFSLAACGDEDSSSDTASSDTQTESDAQEEEETEEAQEVDTGELKTVRIGCVGQSNAMEDALGVAQELGYIDEEMEKVGYQAEVIGFEQAGPAINEAFVSDELDMAIYGDMPALTLKASGTDTTVFAVKNEEMQMAILAQEDCGIESAADLVGHTVIVAVGTIYQEYFKALLEEEGIEEDEVNQINTFSDAASVMATGDADAYITTTANAYYLEEQGIGKVVQTTADRPDLTAQFFAVGKTDYLNENPEAAKALVKAALRGIEYMLENPEESYEIFGERTEYGANAYAKMYAYDESYSYMYPALDDENISRLNDVMEFMLDEGFITETVDVDAFVDPSYAQEAIEEYEAQQ